MLRTLDASRSRPYRVPWQVDRRDERHPVVRNASGEPADFVRVFRPDGSGDSPLKRDPNFYHTTCPECGEKLSFRDGCVTCFGCGYSKCN